MNISSNDPGTPLLSIVVPVFNVGPYLRDGLNSLLQQEIAETFEVILVDDCSTDDSLAICREYADRYPQIFQLIQSTVNAGVSVARNTGFERARGLYLMFFDPDDILPVTALDQLYHAAVHHGADIVTGNLLLFDDKGHRAAPDQIYNTTLVTTDVVLTTLFEHARVRGHVGGKLFLRDKFAGLRFPVGVRMAEDLLFFSEMFAGADSLLLLARDVYLYRKHPHGSSGRKYEKGSYLDWLFAVEQSGSFVSNREQARAHKRLLLRTMTQIARECRKVKRQSAAPVVEVIEQKCEQWNLHLVDLLLTHKLGLGDIGRYIKLKLALRQIRRKLAQGSL